MKEESGSFPLKAVDQLTNADLIIFQTADEKVFIGFSRGSVSGFLYVHGVYQLHSTDLSDPWATGFFPYMYGMTDNTRSYNLQNVLMISQASPMIISMFEKCLREHGVMLLSKSSGGTTEFLKHIPIDSPVFDLVSDIVGADLDPNKRTKH